MDHPLMRGLLPAVVALAAVGLAAAQSDEDLLERERRYLERYLKSTPGADADASSDEEASEPAEPKDRRQQYAEHADRLIRGLDYSAHRSRHYYVQSDDPRLEVERIAQLLDTFREAFAKYWRDDFPPPSEAEASEAEAIRIYLFYSRYKYKQMPGIETRVQADSAGHYSPVTGMLIVHSDPYSEAQLLDTLVHEATHQLMHERVLGASAPTWLQEGMADFFGNSAVDAQGRFQLGVIGRKKVGGVTRGSTWGAGSLVPAKDAIRNFKRFVRQHGEFTVDDVIGAGPDQYYSEAAPIYYTAAWLLCSYLMEGEGGNHRPYFVRYLRDEGWRSGGAEALARTLGITVERLNADWKHYVGRR